MIKVSIDETQIKEAIKKIRFYQLDTKLEMQKAVVGSAFKIRAEAMRLIKSQKAVDKGFLLNSINPEFTADKLGSEIGTNITYAPFIEFGTRYQTARPFLFPAFETERTKFIEKAKQILKLDKGITGE